MYQIPRLTVWLILLCILTVKCNASCLNESCTCCKSGSCTTGHVCFGCKDGYFGEKCHEPCPPNCYNCSQSYLDDGKCYTCKHGYYIGRPSNLTEHPLVHDCSLSCQDGCDLCDSYFNCTQCKREYFMNVKNECIKCQDNCADCSSVTDCRTCNDHYFKNVDRCHQCKPNCKLCNNYTVCRECDKGFYLKGNDCRMCQKECLLCSDINTCYRCRIGFSLFEKQCLSGNGSSVGTSGTSASASETNIGLIVGLVIAFVIIIIVVICVIYKIWKTRRNRGDEHDVFQINSPNTTQAEDEPLVTSVTEMNEQSDSFETYPIKYGPYGSAYLASSGPAVTKSSTTLFWKHIFEKGHGKVVVLSCFESNDSEHNTDAYTSYNGQYGDINVSCENSGEQGSYYRVRKVTMTKETMPKDIQLFHFYAWPNGCTPTQVENFFEFHDKVNDFKTELQTLVYCSAGIERSATYIAFDILTKIKKDRNVHKVTNDEIWDCFTYLKKEKAVAKIEHIDKLLDEAHIWEKNRKLWGGRQTAVYQ